MTTSHAPETSRWLKKKSRKGRRRTYMVCTPPANENVNEKSQPGTGTAEACTRVSSRSRTRHGRFLPLLLLQFLLGGFMKRPTPYIQQDAQVVDLTPWKHAKAVGISLIAIVLVIYLIFAI